MDNKTVIGTVKKLGRPAKKELTDGRLCPQCNSSDIVRYGFYRTKKFGLVRRYRCKECRRQFH
jgi:hypothetical protein